ncbi:ATP phosphoribosyltransferase regulatory subunit [Faecalicatena contorta]|uniref:ATP phosphoribosyltransferase regulatory subunit n=1 Tax=Faecalicatena contorta TaxID=39482 RepID=A0A316A460_9FIRM|nr:ATP phosphoribosyltransferase regulatory subunit [Faecalicatena contorta]PWJ52303.1 ATP phosphoribosyltransferase regulatory subunit [Faecalicatena contorta]SUQ12581.1 ATP phosphoribosyltransferase regulatory subunit [Faecalicatena contorta]
MEQKLHTPEGVRDIYNTECRKKLAVQENLHEILRVYGYKDIQTPTFEYFDVFRKEIGTISSRELYKFFDRDGNTLVLRPDITPSIARAAATLFETEEFPVRLCYIGNTFINHSSYQGRLKENTQLGAELIGADSLEADVEMLAMLVDGLKKAGLKEFQVNIGHVDFIQGLMDATGLDEEEKTEVHDLITNRNYFGVEEILDNKQVKDSLKEAFHVLPELMGDVEILDKALEIAPSMNARLAISHLQQMHKLLTLYGVEDHITFDLSMNGNYGYYTGIIFRAYTYGTGDAIVRGGRYNHLLEKFGKNTPSIGFAIIIDELMSALSRQKISVETCHTNIIVYTEATLKWAIALAKDFREKSRCVEMQKREAGDCKEDYIAYGKRTQAVSMLYLNDDLTIDMINLLTGEEKQINAGSKKGEQR